MRIVEHLRFKHNTAAASLKEGEIKPKEGPPAFRTIRDLHELEALRAIWKSWPGTRDSDPDFFSSMVRSRGSGCRPHVIVLTRNARPDAILIGLRERKKMPVKLGYFTICRPEVNVLEFVHGGLRGNASEENVRPSSGR